MTTLIVFFSLKFCVVAWLKATFSHKKKALIFLFLTVQEIMFCICLLISFANVAKEQQNLSLRRFLEFKAKGFKEFQIQSKGLNFHNQLILLMITNFLGILFP